MAAKKVKFREVKDKWPICPYCEKETQEILYQMRDPILGKDRYVFFCPHCYRILNISLQHDRL